MTVRAARQGKKRKACDSAKARIGITHWIYSTIFRIMKIVFQLLIQCSGLFMRAIVILVHKILRLNQRMNNVKNQL